MPPWEFALITYRLRDAIIHERRNPSPVVEQLAQLDHSIHALIHAYAAAHGTQYQLGQWQDHLIRYRDPYATEQTAAVAKDSAEVLRQKAEQQMALVGAWLGSPPPR